MPLPVSLEPGEALLENDPTEDVINFGPHWKARPLAEVIDRHVDEVVYLPEVIPGDVDGFDGVPRLINNDPTPLTHDWLPHAACKAGRGEAEIHSSGGAEP